MQFACLLDLGEGHVIVVRFAGIVARILDIGAHLRYIGMIDNTAAGASLYMLPGEVAALEYIVKAVVLWAVVHCFLIAWIIAWSQVDCTRPIVHALDFMRIF